ncbi:MAG: IS200/IS605 family element transposase accessory protein TnpB [Chloroflexaceae bacterium]|nr:IS200/IS605 family element transposase accessory protein TnpB [Chloroflexaceae bacterium]
MNTIQRAHKIRLNPTPEQEQYFRQAAGNARFAWNWAVALMRAASAQQMTLPLVGDLKAEFNRIKREQFPFMLDTTKCAPEQAFADLRQALANYFNDIRKRKNGKRRKDGKRVGFPRFNSRKRGYGSFYVFNDKFTVQGHWMKVPKLGWGNMTEPLRFQGKIMSARISERAGYWFVSIQVQLPEPEQTAPERVIGVDLGVKALAVDSDGEVFENQKHLAAALRKLRRVNRWLARKQKGSKNWYKAKRKLARLHVRIANLRADATHKLTTRLAAKASTIALETLNVTGMLKNRKLARAIADASFSEIVRQLGYKAVQVVRIDPFYPSSKTCNECGHINYALTLADRVWTCPGCGTMLDRDGNAARNIRDEGRRLVGAA